MKFTLYLLNIMLFTSLSHAGASEYKGSSFNEVLEVIKAPLTNSSSATATNEASVYDQGLLPQYPVGLCSIFKAGSAPLERDAQRTVSERFDYYDRLPKKLHPNGVCVSGEWQITSQTPYSGLLQSQAQGLFIGRISVAMEETTRGEKRGFGFAGKVFPTMNPQEPVVTANFFTVDVLMGTYENHVLRAKTTNQPEVGFDWSMIGLGLRIASALKTADEDPGFRPLTQLAASPAGQPLRFPRWIRMTPDSQTLQNSESDFRHEVLHGLSDNKTLRYFIEVSETSNDRNDDSAWTRIGEIRLNQAIVSYGCDRRLHFAHPRLH